MIRPFIQSDIHMLHYIAVENVAFQAVNDCTDHDKWCPHTGSIDWWKGPPISVALRDDVMHVKTLGNRKRRSTIDHASS